MFENKENLENINPNLNQRVNLNNNSSMNTKDDIMFIKKSFVENLEEIEKINQKLDNLDNKINKVKSDSAIEMKDNIDIVIKELENLTVLIEAIQHTQDLQNPTIKENNKNYSQNQNINIQLNEIKDKIEMMTQNFNQKFKEYDNEFKNLKEKIETLEKMENTKNLSTNENLTPRHKIPKLHECKDNVFDKKIKIRIFNDEPIEQEVDLTNVNDLYENLDTRPSIQKSTNEFNFHYTGTELDSEKQGEQQLEQQYDEREQKVKIKSDLKEFVNQLEQENTIPTTSPVLSLLFLKEFLDEQILVSGHKNGKINLWEIQNFTLFKFYHEHLDYVDDLKMIKEGLFVSCSKDKTIKLWDVTKDNSVKTFMNDAWTYCITNLIGYMDDLFVTGDQNNYIKIWNLSSYENTSNIIDKNQLYFPINIIESGHKNGISRMLFIPHKKLLLTSSFSEIKLWELSRFLEIEKSTENFIYLTYNEHKDWINGLIYLKDDFFCSASGDKTIKVWRFDSISSVMTLNVHTSFIACIVNLQLEKLFSLSDDEVFILTGSLGKSSKIIKINLQNIFKNENTDENRKIIIHENTDENKEIIVKTFYRDEPISKIELILINKNLKIAGCHFASNNIKIWGKNRDEKLI